MNIKELIIKRNKIRRCISSSTSMQQMLSCFNMIENLDIYRKTPDVLVVRIIQIYLKGYFESKLCEKWQITPGNQEKL